jgi:hypothetical protein
MSQLATRILLAVVVTGSAAVLHGEMPGDEQSAKVVDAANTVLVILNDQQKAALLFPFNDEAQRLRWSNLPSGIFERKGLRMGDLTPPQREAVMNLLKVTLSEAGYQQIVENVAAEEVLNQQSGGRGGRVIFGKDEFYFSILGTPSATEPWMWQFGGHHLAINATIVGSRITLGPSLTGGQPMLYDQKGQQIQQMDEEIDTAFQLVNSLNDTQISKAVLAERFGDMILGPGKDDVRPEPEGLAASELSEAQLELLKQLIAHRVNLLNSEDAEIRMSEISKELSKAHFSWRGSLQEGSAASYRVQGPSFFLEFAPQQMGGSPQNHVHAMYREFDNDYGEQWIRSAPAAAGKSRK